MSKSSSGSDTTKPPNEKPDLSEYEEEKIPLEDVLRQILKAKPAVKPTAPHPQSDEENQAK